MGAIHVLPELVANKIAAGEVIERPSSIVKELVENSLDAGATSIEVEIQHGGKSLIRVSDDGCGMDPADAKLAFQCHATSKILALEDLEGIGSFGFRGEALPSIAAVSRCRLITRSEGFATGTEVVVEGGSFRGVQDHPCRRGTIVEVRDLFFNTPARRKFLKVDSTELGHILEVVCRMALSALSVRFSLKAADQILLDLPPTDRLLNRVTAVMREERVDDFLEFRQEKDGIRLSGVLAKPALNRGNRKEIHLFVNRRWVKALPFTYAIQAGYHGLLMEGRFPVAILFVDLDLKRVDVNVHPAKEEVRISNEQEVASLIQWAVREGLTQSGDLAPSLQMPTGLSAAPARGYLLKSDLPTAHVWGAVMERAMPLPVAEVAAGEEPIPIQEKLRITKILGQIHQTFLVAETEEGFVVVDQHAAHERVVFEALLRNLKTGQPERQMLFLDDVLELHPRQREIFQQAIPLLTKLGFEIEGFGENTFVIRAYPAAFGEIHPIQLIRTFLDEVEEGKVRTALEEAPEAVAALCACKKQSVKAGDPLEPAAMKTLLQRLAACENPFTCPHGRPVFFTQTLPQLEKQFKRS